MVFVTIALLYYCFVAEYQAYTDLFQKKKRPIGYLEFVKVVCARHRQYWSQMLLDEPFSQAVFALYCESESVPAVRVSKTLSFLEIGQVRCVQCAHVSTLKPSAICEV